MNASVSQLFEAARGICPMSISIAANIQSAPDL
jgi:hypothetical protein